MLSPSSPQEIDPDFVSNLAIDLVSPDESRSIIQYHPNKPGSSSADSGSVCRTPSDTTKNVTFNPQVVTVDTSCEIPYSPPVKWRLFKSKKQKQQLMEPPKQLPLPNPNTTAVPIKTILSKSKRSENEVISNEDCGRCFARTEDLPLLSGFNNSVGEPSPSPKFVRRKKYVYPSDIVVINKPPHESAV